MTEKLYITRVANGREWTVTGPSAALHDADKVIWEFRLGSDEPDDLEARFQFADDQYIVPGFLTGDWTSKKPLKNGETFEVRIKRPPPRPGSSGEFIRHFHYAVMISGTNLNGGTSGKVELRFARGTNPPPEIDVGG